MLTAWLRHVRANAVGYLALFIALGGTSYAAVQLPRNSVGTAQIKKNAVTSAKVKNGSLAAADLSKAARKSLRGQDGAQGPEGPAGAKGDPGLSNGPAGGDLSGNYPNPVIAAGAVNSSKLAAVPTVSLAMSATQSFADGGDLTGLPLDVENEDTFGMHDNAAPSRFTAPVAGLYLVTVRVTWAVNNAGLRFLSVRDPNNTIDRVIHTVETARDGSATFLAGTGVERLAAGETREIVVGQTSGGNLNVQSTLTEARVTWIGN